MAKRRNSSGDGILMVVGAFAFLLFSLVVIGAIISPLIIIFMWAKRELRASEYSYVRDARDVIPSSDEIEKVNRAIQAEKRARSDIDSFERRNHDLRKRKDGRYDERSHRGKDANQSLDSLKSRFSVKKLECSDIEYEILGRTKRYASAISKRWSMRISLFIYVVFLFHFAFFASDPDLVSTLIEVGSSSNEIGFSFSHDIHRLIGASGFAAIVALASYLVLHFIRRLFIIKRLYSAANDMGEAFAKV